MKIDKKLSASGEAPDHPPWDLPLDPAGGSAPRPPFRLALATICPTLANPGSTTDYYRLGTNCKNPSAGRSNFIVLRARILGALAGLYQQFY